MCVFVCMCVCVCVSVCVSVCLLSIYYYLTVLTSNSMCKQIIRKHVPEYIYIYIYIYLFLPKMMKHAVHALYTCTFYDHRGK